jgi:hypothetical protein
MRTRYFNEIADLEFQTQMIAHESLGSAHEHSANKLYDVSFRDLDSDSKATIRARRGNRKYLDFTSPAFISWSKSPAEKRHNQLAEQTVSRIIGALKTLAELLSKLS